MEGAITDPPPSGDGKYIGPARRGLSIKHSPVERMTPPDDFLTIVPEPFAMERKLGMTDAPLKLDVMNFFIFSSGH